MPEIFVDTNTDFAPRPGGQQDFWNDHESMFQFLEGGWGAGKTWIGARKFLDIHLFNSFDNAGNPTWVPSAMLGPTLTSIMDYQLPAIEDAAAEIGITAVYKQELDRGRLKSVIYFPELSGAGKYNFIIVRTAERPELITGWEVGAAWGDEAARWKVDRVNPKNDPYLQLTGRVRHPKARVKRLIFTYTNEGDLTRVYEEAHGDKPGHRAFTARTADNDIVKEFYEMQRMLLSKDLADQYLEGGVVRMKGAMIYPEFNKDIHVKPAGTIQLDKNKPLALMMDFNIAPGNHFYIGQIDKTEKIYNRSFKIKQEIYAPRMNVLTGMDRFIETVGSGETFDFPELHVYGDATGENEWAGTSESHYQLVRMKLDKAGIPYRVILKGKNPPIADREAAVNSALMDLENRPHIEIDETCTHLIDDFSKMARGKDGRFDKDANPDLGHGSDAVGYCIDIERPCRVEIDRDPMKFNVGGSTKQNERPSDNDFGKMASPSLPGFGSIPNSPGIASW